MYSATDSDILTAMVEFLDTLFGFARRFRPRSESAPGPLEPLSAFGFSASFEGV